ncbi:MAG: hypothetical protein AAGG69_13460 [Pseudomonadota bacterium]
MTRLEKIEREILELSSSEVRQLGEWLDDKREALFDQQLAKDAESGLLDDIAREALAERQNGKTRPL